MSNDASNDDSAPPTADDASSDTPSSSLLGLSTGGRPKTSRDGWVFDHNFFKDSDIEIRFKHGEQIIDTFEAHKATLTANSHWFEKILRPGGPACDVDIIHLHGDWPWAVRAMIEYMYTGEYIYVFDKDVSFRLPGVSKLDFHVHTYSIATKYGVPRLQDLALHNFMKKTERIVRQKLSDPKFHPSSIELCHRNRSPEANMLRFLNAVQLGLIKTQPGINDAFRCAVFELMYKYYEELAEVDMFNDLLDVDRDFKKGLEEEFKEDGREMVVSGVGWQPWEADF